MTTKVTNKTILDKRDTFTTAKLVEYLNVNFSSKKTGEPFTSNDIQQYLRRKKLPLYAGGHPIEQITEEEIGIKVIKVHFDRKAPRKSKNN